MVYCVSDIHGEILRWNALLEMIQFSKNDTMYVLGDVIDRNSHGIEILRDIMTRPNIHMIIGNHEQMMLDSFLSADVYEARRHWRQNGGGSTYRTMMYKLSYRERLNILSYVEDLPDYLEIEVSGRQFYLVHGMIGKNRHDRIWCRPEPPPEKLPLPGKTVIVGHTCTYWLTLEDDTPFKIWYGPGLIDIDCGCGNNIDARRLACLRLDDMREFYV